MTDDDRMAEKESPETQVHKPVVHAALPTPCSVQDLNNWLKSVNAVSTGQPGACTITASASSLTVA